MSAALGNLRQSWVKGVLSHTQVTAAPKQPPTGQTLCPLRTQITPTRRGKTSFPGQVASPTKGVLQGLLEPRLAYPLYPQGPGVADADSLTGRPAFQQSWTAPRPEETVLGLSLVPSNFLGVMQTIEK